MHASEKFKITLIIDQEEIKFFRFRVELEHDLEKEVSQKKSFTDLNASNLKVNIYRLRQVKCKWAALPVLTQTLAKQLCRCLANLAVNK